MALAAIGVFSWRAAADPRSPAPPLPEPAILLHHESFDWPYRYGGTNAEAVVTSAGVLTQSWSGYGLDRSGPVVMPFVIPALEAGGQTNVSCGSGGAVRLWVQPYWQTASATNNSSGPGQCAKLVELAAVGGSQAVPVWSLEATPDGSALSLVSQTDAGPVESLRAAILWETGAPHCVALNYGPQGTTLFIDGQPVASGAGTPCLPPSAGVLVVGSGVDGTDAAESELDEFFSFATPLMAADMAFYYRGTAIWAALGPVTAAEKAAWYEAAALSLAARQAAGMSPQDQSPPSGPPCGDGSPVYLTNVLVTELTTQSDTVSFTVAGGSNGVAYSLYRATNLVPALSDPAWHWVRPVYACDTVVLNETAAGAFYVVGPPPNTMVIAWGDDAEGQCTVPLGLSNVVAVAGGLFHSLALRSDGTVVGWGANEWSQADAPAGLSNVVGIAASWNQSVAVMSDGTMTNWGETYGTVPELTNVVAVSAGWEHVLALLGDGTLAAWGDDLGATVPAGLPVVTAIASGWEHNVVLLADGTVTAWGVYSPQLGYTPTNVPAGLSNVTAVAAGALHSLALRSDGTVVAWGYNFSGQTNVPANLSNVVAIAGGASFSSALRSDGSVVIWGDFASGAAYVPEGLESVPAIGAGSFHALAVCPGAGNPVLLEQPVSAAETAGGSVTFTASAVSLAPIGYQWQLDGVDISGATNASLTLDGVEAGDNGTYCVVATTSGGSITSTPATFTLITPPVITALTQPAQQWAGYQSNVVLSVTVSAPAQGAAPLHYQWQFNGTNLSGATGSNYTIYQANWPNDGTYTVIVTNVAGSTNASWSLDVLVPGSVCAWGYDNDGQCDCPPGLTNVVSLAGGFYHTVALREDGTVTAWGDDEWGQTDVPAGLSNVTAIACGYTHSLALRADGTVVAWGSDESGETDVPAGLTNVVAIAAGGLQSLALQANGALAAWGMGTSPMPASVTNVTAIAAGFDFDLALMADGTVAAWGDYGPVTSGVYLPTDLTNIVAISAGAGHALALRSDGTVESWGLNASGETSVPAGLSNVMAVAGGMFFSMALCNDGTVVVWGEDGVTGTNMPSGLSGVKCIGAGVGQALAGLFSPLVQYPVDVTKDLLLIYNTNSPESAFVKDYYLAYRPGVSGANVLGIGCPTNELTDTATFTNQILAPMQVWLAGNPTKRPQYVILFPDLPTRVWGNTNDVSTISNSVAFGIAMNAVGAQPFVTSINMGLFDLTNDCIAYINKLAQIGASNSPGKLIISASAGTYGNTNYILDNARVGTGYFPDYSGAGSVVSTATNGLLARGVSPSAIIYNDGLDTITTVITNGVTNNIYYNAPQITSATNVSGYICWGEHSALGATYATNGAVQWTGNGGWWIIETIESFNGQRAQVSFQGSFIQWFSSGAFGGINYSNTPIGAVTHTDEPYLKGVENSATYFGLWAAGKNFAISAWNSRNTPNFQAVGDPFTIR